MEQKKEQRLAQRKKMNLNAEQKILEPWNKKRNKATGRNKLNLKREQKI
jgi:hypothetical protein